MAQTSETLDALFVNLVLIFKNAAFQQMGKILNPMTGKVDKNLEQARFSIDMIEMLKEKTRGNLSEDLEKLVDSTLLELRMNYVEEANAQEKPEEEAQPEKPEEARPDEAGAEEATGSKTESESDPQAQEPGPETGEVGPKETGSAKAGPGGKKKGRKRGKKA